MMCVQLHSLDEQSPIIVRTVTVLYSTCSAGSQSLDNTRVYLPSYHPPAAGPTDSTYPLNPSSLHPSSYSHPQFVRACPYSHPLSSNPLLSIRSVPFPPPLVCCGRPTPHPRSKEKACSPPPASNPCLLACLPTAQPRPSPNPSRPVIIPARCDLSNSPVQA